MQDILEYVGLFRACKLVCISVVWKMHVPRHLFKMYYILHIHLFKRSAAVQDYFWIRKYTIRRFYVRLTITEYVYSNLYQIFTSQPFCYNDDNYNFGLVYLGGQCGITRRMMTVIESYSKFNCATNLWSIIGSKTMLHNQSIIYVVAPHVHPIAGLYDYRATMDLLHMLAFCRNISY